MEAPRLGARGEGWVWLQLALMAAVFAAGWFGPGWPDAVAVPLAVAGVVVAVAGAALAVWAGRSLGGSLTPYPAPSDRGTLVEAGPYAAVRHPIYAGGILFFAGFGLFSSPPALGLAGALAVLWALKATVEERLLRERYPGYEAYAARVPHRLVPGVF